MRARWHWLFALIGVSAVVADEHDHIYKDGDEVVLWMNTVGPYENRQETYDFFSLPFCKGSRGETLHHHHETIGEALQGMNLESSGLEIRYNQPVDSQIYCTQKISQRFEEKLMVAVQQNFWYQMYLDGLPLWAPVGYVKHDGTRTLPDTFGREQGRVAGRVPDGGDDGDSGNGDRNKRAQAWERNNQGMNAAPGLYLYTHKTLVIETNADHIVAVSIEVGNPVLLTTILTSVTFSYAVNWKQSTVKFENRFDRYLEPSFFQHKIHWFSIANSFIMVMFLVGAVTYILRRTLSQDYARYDLRTCLSVDSVEFGGAGGKNGYSMSDMGDEYGWKLVHADVFRRPNNHMWLSAALGNGAHLCATIVAVTMLIVTEHLYTQSGSIVSWGVTIAAVLTPISGFIAGAHYRIFQGEQWQKQSVLTAVTLPVLGMVCSFVVNCMALYYNSSQFIGFKTQFTLFCIIIFVSCPLTLIGSIVGRNVFPSGNFPTRVNNVLRYIPEKKWYLSSTVIVPLAGLLPFGAIFVEMYYVLVSFWAYKVYYVYGFVLLVFCILAVVVMCVSLVATYLLLNAEDWRWHWNSFLYGASIAVYIYGYSIYYFHFKTRMYGALQTTYFFAYMALGSVLIGLACGFLAYTASFLFVRRIFSGMKID
eukprot:Clim_evm8s27 gene=Clim_evmTU8s27